MRVRGVAAALVAASLALGAQAGAQEFFPDGRDFLNYDSDSGPTGRIYVGDASGRSPCHYRYELPAGKVVTDVELESDSSEVGLTNGEGEVVWLSREDFERVDPQGNPCSEDEDEDRIAAALAAAPPTEVSNDADSLAVFGRWAVVVGANSPTPVSLVDRVTGFEVDTLAASGVGTFAAIADDGVTVLALLDGNQLDTASVRKLTIGAGGTLEDTGLAFALGGSNNTIAKTYVVPGARFGLAITKQFGPGTAARIESFGLADMLPIDAAQIGGLDDLSAAVAPTGDAVYVRSNDDIQGWTLDPVTGAIGDDPFLAIPGVGQPFIPPVYGNALGISADATRLVASEPTPTPEAPTPRVTYFDATSGARLGFLSPAMMVRPTLIAVVPEPGAAGAGSVALFAVVLLRRRA